MVQIRELKVFTPADVQAVRRLLSQLTDKPIGEVEHTLSEIISQENSHLFLLTVGDEVAGMLTVGIYYSPTGGKAWIEDVVVDEKYRGQGFGKRLVRHAIGFVEECGIPLLMLTSNPARIAANKLYRELGFEQKHTNVYRMKTN